MYTKIDLQDLKSKLKWAVDKAFKGGSNQWIRVNGKDAQFNCRTKRKTGNLYSKTDIGDMIDYIVDNAIFAVGVTAY